jgi:histone-lysine N-methyltransferase SETMAR
MAIQNTRRGILTSGVALLHDNTHVYTAFCHTQALLEHNRELYDQPAYSPDLASSDYHLFTYMKNSLQSQCFNDNEKLMKGVKT